MPWNLLGSVVSGLFNSANTIATNNANKQIAKEQMQWQQQENERAFQRDLEMWDMQNQYNSPEAQRQRIEAAGGNAMLAFGNGVSINSGNNTNAPSLQPAKAITPTLTPYTGWNLGSNTLLDNLHRHQLFEGQKRLQEAEISNKEQDARYKGLTNDLLSGTKDYQIEKTKEELRSVKNANTLFDQTKDLTIKSMENDLNLSAAQLELAIREIERIDNEVTLQEFEMNMRRILSDEKFVWFQNFIMPVLQLGVSAFGEYRRWHK